MVENNIKDRQLIASLITAGFLLFAFDFIYNATAEWLNAPVTASPISQELVDGLPIQIGSWIGQDVPIDENIIRFTGTDAYISRRYSRNQGLENILLYIPCGTNARALAAHRPEVCYPSAGKMLMNRTSAEFTLKDGTVLPYTIFIFSSGGLNIDKVFVLNYFIIDDKYCGDYSLLESKAWRGSDTVVYIAQVQITASITGSMTTDSMTKIISDFAIDSAIPIANLFKSIDNNKLFDIPDGPN
jgi:hypothetical protein